MAQRVEVKLIDDLDGGDAAETVSFSLDGISYEIDLSDKHAKKLRDEFAAWTGHARRSGAGARSGSRRRSAASGGAKRTDLGAVREWATGQRSPGVGPRPHLGRGAVGLRQGPLTDKQHPRGRPGGSSPGRPHVPSADARHRQVPGLRTPGEALGRLR